MLPHRDIDHRGDGKTAFSGQSHEVASVELESADSTCDGSQKFPIKLVRNCTAPACSGQCARRPARRARSLGFKACARSRFKSATDSRPNRDADQRFVDAGALAIGGCDPTVCRRCRMRDRRPGVAEIGGDRHRAHRIDHAPRSFALQLRVRALALTSNATTAPACDCCCRASAACGCDCNPGKYTRATSGRPSSHCGQLHARSRFARACVSQAFQVPLAAPTR